MRNMTFGVQVVHPKEQKENVGFRDRKWHSLVLPSLCEKLHCFPQRLINLTYMVLLPMGELEMPQASAYTAPAFVRRILLGNFLFNLQFRTWGTRTATGRDLQRHSFFGLPAPTEQRQTRSSA